MNPPGTAVLTALTGQDSHAVDLLRRTGLSSGTLYPLLVRLQRANLIEAYWSSGRRAYRLTGPPPLAAAHRPGLRTALLWLPAALVALVTVWVTLTRPPHALLTDLSVYTGAVGGLTHGASLYDFISTGDAPFTYPPFAGLVFLPLAGVPAFALQLGWTLATVATVVGLARLLGRRAPLWAALLLLSAPVASNLKFGQVSVFLAALIAVDVLALRRSRWQGLLIGLAAAIKLTPLIFIPMLWFAGRRRAAVLATATFAACGTLAALALPGDSWRFWTTEVSQVSRLGHITGIGNQSLNAALLRLDLSAPARSAIVLLAGGTIAALALHRAAVRGRTGDWLSALILTGAAGLVLSPVSWTHHQIWLVLAALLPVAGGVWIRRVWPVLVLTVMLLPLPALGPPLWSNSRLLLAITIAVLLPLARHGRLSEGSGGLPGDEAPGRTGDAAHGRPGDEARAWSRDKASAGPRSRSKPPAGSETASRPTGSKGRRPAGKQDPRPS